MVYSSSGTDFNFSAPFGLEIAATLLIDPLLVGVAGISRAKGACLQGQVWRSYLGSTLSGEHAKDIASIMQIMTTLETVEFQIV